MESVKRSRDRRREIANVGGGESSREVALQVVRGHGRS